MAVSSNCLCHHQLPLKINLLTPAAVHLKSTFPPKVLSTEFYGTHIGSRATLITNSRSSNRCRKILLVQASWFESVGLAGHAFTVGTAAVLPFYILMVAAPKAELTKRCMRSSIPYVILGVFYFYLLYLSWTPDTVRLVFASKYLLPELPSVAKMFSNDMTLASAWIHLLAIDLFAARQVYHDGLENKIDTRHSVSLCLLSCPIGILVHAITKAITKTSRESKSKIQ